jgi:hypothetical protein
VDLSQDLKTQLNNFIVLQAARCLNRYDDSHLREKVRQNFGWMQKFAEAHYKTRIKRAMDLKSKEIMEAQKLARTYIGKGNHDFFVTCVDGRNMPTVMFSKPPHIGGVLRTPAGVVAGFMEGQQEKNSVFIDRESYVVKRITDLLREKAGNTIFYGLDSHLGCAARTQIHSTEGSQQTDGGVRADILNKMMTAKGILQLRSRLSKGGEDVANIIPLFFSFDPSTGGAVIGLEIHVNDERVANEGYTGQVLDRLAARGLIVRTMDIMKDEKITALLREHIKPGAVDFRNYYAHSLLSNWQVITKLYENGKGEIFTHILGLLKKAYKKTDVPEKVINQKAKFVLKNLITRYSIAGSDGKWPYDSHKEEMIVITDGGYAPFSNIDAFSVFSHDLNDLLYNVKLPIDLIRSFRRGGKISDPIVDSGFSQEEFSSAPVLVSNKSIFRDFQPESWEALKALRLNNIFSQIDWDNVAVLNWNKSDVERFIFKAVHDKKVIIEFDDALRLIEGIYELFNKMRLMMKDKHFRQMMLHGNIVILNTLVDHDRMPRYIVDFVV